ncbi:MAG TPA: SIMPL domain-containing protein [Bryobacteraceae bacterium]|nr:SIMPL domain-containing protein [Bryobacteraceae bacterium]
MQRVSFLAFFLTCSVQAQLPTRPFVEAAGSATVSSAPDQATIDATVGTTGTSAQDAAAKNANQVTGLLAALGKLLGPGANIQTISYYIYPNYQNTPPYTTVVGYTANSTVEVTLSDLTQAGAVIDTAVANGATSLGGINFSLKDPEPQRQQALRMATQQAMNHANAMATASGHTVGNIRSVQEGSIVQVTPIYGPVGGGGAGGGGGAPTPVQPGTIQVQETVTVTADLN